MVFSNVVSHRGDTAPDEFTKWDSESELYLYESTNLFGSWKIIHNENPRSGYDHTRYPGQIPGKWFSSDNLSGTIMLGSDYTHGKNEYYCRVNFVSLRKCLRK